MNIRTCTLQEKVRQIQPVSNFCTCLINPTVYISFQLYMRILIVYLFFLNLFICQTVLCQLWLQHACRETSSQIRTPVHYRGQLEVLIWHQLNMFRTFYGVTSETVIMSEHVLKYSLHCVVNRKRSRRMTSEPLRDRCYAGESPVCRLTAIPLIKHYVKFKNDPYPVL